ncbi:uncharacterized protein LOC129456578 [Periophthalmus magnuspinnatus]|uniref:uncharacterized protein LOC129456578 n=1 Tax=Periophthalmus magnuspinnatus TaxID=409849 RepID=UPI0024369475|nr:uncharacterized protein LOC129456578 [Periophthalmus magnuspinnatus]
MWCYQKPGFEALLLAELQKQQQSSQFCDIVLKADGVSVPAHSCVLSAISSQFSTSLSQTPTPTQKRLLEFRSLGACTLLHLVRLLYSGEMVGEGEREKREAVSAAARLGIHGLVEVSHIDGEHRRVQDECLYTEVAVQTDSQLFGENQVRLGGWRREVKDGTTVLWRERLPTCGTEIWTQTEDLQTSSPSCSQPPITYETIDLNALQSLGHTEPLQIPYVPMSVVCPIEDSHSYGQSSVSVATLSPAVDYSSVHNHGLPISNQAMPCAAETPHWGQNMGRASGMDELADEGFQQFEGNIPGFINYFLNPEHEKGSNRRRGRRRQGVGLGGARQSGMRGGPRGRRGLTQTVDVQDVGVSKLSKMYLQRWGMYVNRTGQGGGAVGRKLYVKSREFVRSRRSTLRQKGRGLERDMDQYATIRVKSEAARRGQRGRPRRGISAPVQELVSPPQRARRGTKWPTAQGPEEQPEHIDLLLEEVMMGMDIIPNNNAKSQITSSTCHHGAPAAIEREKRQCGTTTLVGMACGGRDPPSSEVPVLQQQNKGELTDILDQFLQSFECLESAEAQSSSESSESHTSVKQYRKHNIQLSLHTPHCSATPTPIRFDASTTSETSGTDSPVGPAQIFAQQSKNSEKACPARKRPARRKRDFLFSLEKPKTKKRPAGGALNKEEVKQRITRQLQLIPVVKLERRDIPPESIKVQELSQSAELRAKKSPTQLWGTKTYPIRSRFKEAQITDAIPFLEVPLSNYKSKTTKHGLLPSPSCRGISLSTVEEQMESYEDENGSDMREPEQRGRKRASDSNEDMSSNVEVKRICHNSAQSTSQTADTEVIDVETISPSSTSNTVLINNTGEADVIDKENSTDTENNAIIDVEGLEGDFNETGLNREDLVHTEMICSLRADIVTAGKPEDLDNDIDVIGGSSPAPSPVFLSWTDSSEAEEDTEADTLDQQAVALPKERLVPS